MTNTIRTNAPVTVDPSNPIAVMQRYELKYILNSEQKKYVEKSIEGHMRPDSFGLTSIQSLYYDTPNYRLIRDSLEKPEFKEKIRLRSYGQATQTSPVFLELKRKAYGIVYKRRIKTTIPTVREFFAGERDIGEGGQIDREITAFRDHYKDLVPSCLIIYDRTAYFEPDGDLRLTIDGDPRYRSDDLRLDCSTDGKLLLKEEGSAILEIKVQSSIPLWLVDILSGGEIYKGSFSKYGEAYKRELFRIRKSV